MAQSELAKATLTVTYKEVCEATNKGFTLQLDDVKNVGKTSFAPGDIAYIRVYPGGFRPDRYITMGNSTSVGSGVDEIDDECVTFVRSDSGSKQYYSERCSFEWLGRYRIVDNRDSKNIYKDSDSDSKGGSSSSGFSTEFVKVRFDGWDIYVSEVVSGIMKLTYDALYDLWSLTCSEEATVLVEAELLGHPKFGDMYGSIIVDFTAETTIRDCFITVKDACTGSIVAGASIGLGTPGGVKSFVTDAAGRAHVGQLMTGASYPIDVSAYGYQSSNADRLANDSITIQG
jgi:hypothetical protein